MEGLFEFSKLLRMTHGDSLSNLARCLKINGCLLETSGTLVVSSGILAGKNTDANDDDFLSKIDTIPRIRPVNSQRSGLTARTLEYEK